MGVSTDGEICYGIVFDDGYEFPWDNDVDSGDSEDWWIRVVLNRTYTNYAELKEIRQENPIPFELVNYCSGEYPMYILAVPGTVLRANRGYAKEFNPADLKVDEEASKKLIAFCEEYGLEGESAIGWKLTSYMG